ncbi:hypothetical protein ACOME3_005003 [Neoechinorhynchus agilis]
MQAAECRLRLCSFNILAQDLLEEHRTIYHGIDEHFLKWENRCPLILTALSSGECHILCLQEVQVDHYCQIHDYLTKFGFEGYFTKRDDPKTDGCATFYQTNTFSRITNIDVNLQRGLTLSHPNVAQITILQHNAIKDFQLCVCNVHICFNPRRGDVKLAQIVLVLSELYKYTRHHDGHCVPIILAGDFNVTSNSPIWKFISGEEISVTNCSRNSLAMNDLCNIPGIFLPMPRPLLPDELRINKKCQHDNDKQTISNSCVIDAFKHELNLNPVYPGDTTLYGIYQWPNVYGDLYVEVDHVFYSNGTVFGLNPVLCTLFHYPGFAVPNGRIPAQHNGSDHYPLYVEFVAYTIKSGIVG